MVVLIGVVAADGSEQFELRFDAAKRITVGRDPGCHVQLPDVSVSSSHATLIREGDGYEVLDEGSTNGTRINGKPVPSGQRRKLKHDDTLQLGRAKLQLRFATLAARSPGLPPSTADMALAMVRGALLNSGSEVGLEIRVVEGPVAGLRMALHEDRTLLVGTCLQADIVLPGVTSEHARIAVRGSKLWVMDLGSQQGSQLEGRALDPNHSVRWHPFAELVIGDHRLRVEDPVSSALASVQSAPDEPITGFGKKRSGQKDSPASLRRKSRGLTPETLSVREQQAAWKVASSTDFNFAPASPIEAISYPESEPPVLLEHKPPGWSVMDALVVAVAGVTVLLSCLVIAWFLNG